MGSPRRVERNVYFVALRTFCLLTRTHHHRGDYCLESNTADVRAQMEHRNHRWTRTVLVNILSLKTMVSGVDETLVNFLDRNSRKCCNYGMGGNDFYCGANKVNGRTTDGEWRFVNWKLWIRLIMKRSWISWTSSRCDIEIPDESAFGFLGDGRISTKVLHNYKRGKKNFRSDVRKVNDQRNDEKWRFMTRNSWISWTRLRFGIEIPDESALNERISMKVMHNYGRGKNNFCSDVNKVNDENWKFMRLGVNETLVDFIYTFTTYVT